MKYNGKNDVFPTATKDKIYVGKQQFNRYKKAIAAHQASQPATIIFNTPKKSTNPLKHMKTNNKYRQ